MSVEPFKRLVRLVARALYDDEVPQKSANPGKSSKSDNKGIAVVVLDALTRRTWVKEEELAKCLKLHPKQLRRTLRLLENEMLIVREDHKETVKAAKAYNAAVAVSTDAAPPVEAANEKTRVLVHSYCCLDYAQVCDVVRYRIHRAKKKIKDDLEDKNTLQEYLCPDASCARRYSALDASRLISADGNFHCERCDAELVAENDKLAPKELADGDSEESARRRQREKLKEMLERMEVQLKPLIDQLAKLKDIRPPVCLPFTQWQEKLLSQRLLEEGGDKSSSDRPGVPMPFMGETKVMVEIGGTGTKDDKKEDTEKTRKVLPPWMIRQGMELTPQQRGEVKREENGTSDQKPVIRDVKPANDEKTVEAEYAKAFYEAYMKQQLAGQQQQQQQQQQQEQPLEQQQLDAVENGEQERKVGVKAKRELDDEEIVWEDGPSALDGGAGEEATEEAHAEVDDEDIDWE